MSGIPDDTPPDPLVGTTVAERYRIRRLLGAGGMGAVYEAQHVLMRKRVALKVLHRELTHLDEVVARFEREAVAAARIDHANVVAATDFGRLDDGAFYLVLEFVDGQSLSALIEEGPIEPERALRIAREVALALEAAHAAGIIHRDLKPDNIMIVGESGSPQRVKVLDFGIAKLGPPEGGDARTQLTRIGTVMGTATYMSPEQALGQPVDARTDLYALGIIVHEMLSGQPPFDAEEVTQVLAQQITQPPPALPASVPPEIKELVGALLEKGPPERPESARDVIHRIDQCLAGPGSAAGFAAPVTVRGGGGDASVSVDGRTVLDAGAAANTAISAPLAAASRPVRVGAAASVAVAAIVLGAWLASDDEEASAAPAATGSTVPSASSDEPARTDVVLDPATGTVATATRENAPRRAAIPVASKTSQSKTSTMTSAQTETQSGTTGTKTSKTTQSTHTKSTTKSATQTKSTQTKSSKKRKGLRIPHPREWFK